MVVMSSLLGDRLETTWLGEEDEHIRLREGRGGG